MQPKILAKVEDYLKLPEGAKYQLIEGEIIEMPSQKLKHQKVLLNISTKLQIFVNDKKRVLF